VNDRKKKERSFTLRLTIEKIQTNSKR